jgi:hypothetical protein
MIIPLSVFLTIKNVSYILFRANKNARFVFTNLFTYLVIEIFSRRAHVLLQQYLDVNSMLRSDAQSSALRHGKAVLPY